MAIGAPSQAQVPTITAAAKAKPTKPIRMRDPMQGNCQGHPAYRAPACPAKRRVVAGR
jgi:hypothetical protein